MIMYIAQQEMLHAISVGSLDIFRWGRGGGIQAVYLNSLTGVSNDEPWMVMLLLNDHPMQFKMDTEANVTVIPNKVLQKLHHVMLCLADRQLHGANNQRLTVKECFKGNLKSKIYFNFTAHIRCAGSSPMPLLGRPAIEALGLFQRIESISSNPDCILFAV